MYLLPMHNDIQRNRILGEMHCAVAQVTLEVEIRFRVASFNFLLTDNFSFGFPLLGYRQGHRKL